MLNYFDSINSGRVYKHLESPNTIVEVLVATRTRVMVILAMKTSHTFLSTTITFHSEGIQRAEISKLFRSQLWPCGSSDTMILGPPQTRPEVGALDAR